MSILQTPIIINTTTEPIVQEYLPTPQISVVGSKDGGLWKTVDNISWRKASITDVMALTYTPEYYQAEFDIYMNSFGADRKFLELPDLRLELCRVSNRSQGGGSASTNNLMGQTSSTKLKSQKDHAATNIVHSASIPVGGNIGNTVKDTKYSGGNGTFDITEWNFPETDYHNGKINRFSNPSLRITLDLRKYFRSTNGGYDTNTIFPIQSGVGSWFQTRNSHGRTKDKSGTKQKFYTRNAVFFFRLSAGVPNTDINGVYQQRIYSNLSILIYIKPVVRTFYNTAGDINSGSESCIYHYKIGLGNRP